MNIKSDIEIAQEHTPKKITEIAAAAGIDEKYLELYGNYKAKVDIQALKDLPRKSKLVLVTAISPTPAGEGKTTTSVGLADALNRLGKRTIVCLREPSLGPVFGVKGGAAGGGHAQVIPMEDINLHFTGDFHAIGIANNLMAALIDNHIHQGNALNIDTRKVVWKRVVDMNDRQLRHIVCGMGGKASGVPREDGFDITVASEVMAIFCLATSIADLKDRLSRIVCAYTYDGKPVTAGQVGAAGAMTALLKDALDPNLVQTLENNPAIIHGGPFANIAHGCNSVMATKLSLALSDYVITEAGFGADLGAEKFLDIKCRYAGIAPSACVLVATVRALKSHGGVAKADLNTPNPEAVRAGAANLVRHIDNLKNGFGLPVVVAINAFPTDTPEEQAIVEQVCELAVPADLQALEENVRLQKFYLDNYDPENLMWLDNKFHENLFRIARKSQIHSLIQNISIHFDRVRSMSLVSVESQQAAVRDHTEITRQICAGNAELARQQMETHLNRYKFDAVKLQAEFPQYFKRPLTPAKEPDGENKF